MDEKKMILIDNRANELLALKFNCSKEQVCKMKVFEFFEPREEIAKLKRSLDKMGSPINSSYYIDSKDMGFIFLGTKNKATAMIIAAWLLGKSKVK